MSTLLGIVTFGNLPFTKLAIEEVRRTASQPVDLFVIVGKPGDRETEEYLLAEDIPHSVHLTNKGFAASINDIYDYAWNEVLGSPLLGRFCARRRLAWPYDNVIIMGNDVIPYPHAIDRMIGLAQNSDWEWICSSQFDARSLVERYPQARPFFTGDNLTFTNFSARPWDAHLQEVEDTPGWEIQPHCIKDVRNLTLFKRSVFDKIGYADVNFWPGGYFEDNDYCTRARLAGLQACGLAGSAYFHFWSRTIHQGGKGEEHHPQFRNNSAYYEAKWGGGFESEAWALPFNGRPYQLKENIHLLGSVHIASRVNEGAIISYWEGKK